MICHRVEMVAQAHRFLSGVLRSELDRALANVAALKAKLAPPDPFSMGEFRRRDEEVRRLRVDTLGAELAAQRSPEDGKRSPVETY